jgi:hypothetical protein
LLIPPDSKFSTIWPNAAHGISKASKITFFMQRDGLKKKLILTVLNVTVNIKNNITYSK